MKMSDMDEDFMYDQDDDYGLVGSIANPVASPGTLLCYFN